MARVVYGDITLISFTPANGPDPAATVPTQTQLSALITRVYKRVYTKVYGVGNYSADESTDTKDIIDTDDMKEVIISITERVTEMWHWQGRSSGEGKHYLMPNLRFTNKETKDIKEIVWRKTAVDNPIRTPQLWNEARDDVLVR